MLSKLDFNAYKNRIYKEGFEAGATATIELVTIEFGVRKAKKIFNRMFKNIEKVIKEENGK